MHLKKGFWKSLHQNVMLRFVTIVIQCHQSISLLLVRLRDIFTDFNSGLCVTKETVNLVFTFDHIFVGFAFFWVFSNVCSLTFNFTDFESLENLEIVFLSRYFVDGFLTNPFFYCLLLAPNYCVKMYQRDFWRMMLTASWSPLCTLSFYALFWRKQNHFCSI